MTDEAAPSLIDVQKLTKVFGLRVALRGVSFTIGRSEIVALLGPNGSGKTTLMRILAALSKPTSGTVTVGGWSLPREAAAVRARLGVVAHLPLLYDDLTAAENLRFYAQLYGEVDPVRIRTLLARVGLDKRANDLVRTFSRGMVQRLALARAVVHDPAVLILDEPYTGLDTFGIALLDSLLDDWRADGRTVIISLHDIRHAAEIAHRALILRQGTLVGDLAIDADMDLPSQFAQIIGDNKPLSRAPG